jgi:hypothetical protein
MSAMQLVTAAALKERHDHLCAVCGEVIETSYLRSRRTGAVATRCGCASGLVYTHATCETAVLAEIEARVEQEWDGWVKDAAESALLGWVNDNWQMRRNKLRTDLDFKRRAGRCRWLEDTERKAIVARGILKLLERLQPS